MKIKTHPIYISPQKDANDDKYGMPENACICCGKPTNGTRWIHATTGGVAINVSDLELEGTEYESQGAFPVGPNCAKRFPIEFIIKHSV